MDDVSAVITWDTGKVIVLKDPMQIFLEMPLPKLPQYPLKSEAKQGLTPIV